ncbi:MAG: IS66-like element accessory protein TnpA [Thiohalocapsa sp.]
MTGRFERVEVITGVAGRRRWSVAEKLRIVGELGRPGATVSSVARAHDVHASLLFKWRRLAREGALGRAPDDAFSIVPVRLLGEPSLPPTADERAAADDAAGLAGMTVEIALPNGCVLRVSAGIDAARLRRLVTVLKSAG